MMHPSSFRAITREQDKQRTMERRVAEASARRAAEEPCPHCGKIHPRQPLGIGAILGSLVNLDHDADNTPEGGGHGSLQ